MQQQSVAGLDAVLDRKPWSRMQVTVFGLCGLVGVLDGYDTQVMAVGAASIARALGVVPAAMGYAIVAGLAGAAIGAVTGGQLADRIGRRRTLIAVTLLFGLFNIATPFARSVPELAGLRFLAGLGLGGAAPVFVALASGYAPTRRRGAVASLVWSSFPLGITIGGFTNGLILSRGPWQAIFFAGGAGAVAVAALLMALLPESLEFLAARPGRAGDLQRTVARIAPGVTLRPSPGQAGPRQGGTPVALFRAGYARATLLLWGILFCCFGTTAVAINYVPLILHQNGVSASAGAFAVSWHGLGALAGMLVAGRLVDRYGPAAGLVPPLLLGAAAAVMLGYAPGSAGVTSVFFALVGCLVGLGASGAIAMATIIYPATIRGTGAGWGLGMGRLGQVTLPALFGALLLHEWSVQAAFACLAVMPLLASAFVLLLARSGALGRKSFSPPDARTAVG